LYHFKRQRVSVLRARALSRYPDNTFKVI